MKKKLLDFLISIPFLMEHSSLIELNRKSFMSAKLKLTLVLLFIYTSLWAQPPHTFTADGSVVIPAGITTMDIQAWGAGGAGGGAGNSGLLNGRSGGGGGGGAYAHGTITVNPLSGIPLNIKVAGATTGTTATGATGGSSTIQGFETVILAVGGAGGTANAGGATPGGAGGLGSASIGSISTASGATGGNGSAALLSAGLSSGAGGTAGGIGGGAGGASRTTVLLGNGPGIVGDPPGGGGSGALHTGLNSAQAGGSGAHGQVIVTYTCPTYNITGISANNVCITSPTSLVTVTASAALLPVGIYTVTYSRGTPAATGLTASMTVNSAGTGSFTAVGLTTAGTSSITVTGLTSGVCTATITGITTNVTVSPVTVQGAVSGGTTICNGATSALLSLTGNIGSVIQWESSVSPFSAWTPIVNTASTYTSGALTETTQFRAVVQSGTCTVLNSTLTTVTVNPLPQGSLSANGPFCATGAGLLTFTATGGVGPYTVVYNDGASNHTANSVVSGTAFATAVTPVISTTTYTLVSVTDTNTTCIRSTGFTGGSAIITINALPIPVFPVQPAATTCVSDIVTYTTLAGQTNYLWAVPGVAGVDYNITSGGISTTNNTVSLQWVTTGSKTVTVSYSSNGCAAVVNASNTTAVIETLPGVVSGGSHVCIGNPSPLLTLGGYNGTIVRWEYAESLPYVWQPISHTGITYQPGVLSTSTSYRAVIKNGTCTEAFATETRVDIDPRPATPVPGTQVQPTCVNPTGSVVLNNLLATPNWTINQSGTASQTYTNSGTSYTVTNLAPGTYYFTIQDGANCSSLLTTGIVITAPVVNIWNGSVWSKGSPPISTDSVEFAGSYQTNGNLTACSCIVHPGVNVTVNSNDTLIIENAVDNNGGTLIFENNASLLQLNNATNTGNITYKRNTTPVRRYDFTHWSSPITRTPDFTLHDLSPNTLGDKYARYNQLGGNWETIYNGAAPMLPGVGYIIRAPQSYDLSTPSIYYGSFIGVPNNGPYVISLVAAEKWSLLGNPYPSAIYADQFIFDNTANIYGTLYFWTHNSPPALSTPGGTVYSYSSDDYAIYNLSGSVIVGGMTGDGATTPGNQNPPSGYIAAGQAFFVKAKTGQNAVFTNSMRIAGNNTQFFKNANSKIEKNRVWLNLTNTQGAFKQLLVGYIEGATNGWDTNYDGITVDANEFLDFYSINGDLKLVIQGRALPFIDSDLVPLGYRSAIAGDFTIAIDHSDGNLSTQPIYLEDKIKGVTHDLRVSNYTFTTAIGTFTDRFVLRYKKSLGTEDFEKDEKNIIVFAKNKSIKIASSKETLKEVAVYDISGNMLYDKKKIGNSELQITNLQSGDQVLLVKVILENGHVSTKKVVF